jgi:hypothetical protein
LIHFLRSFFNFRGRIEGSRIANMTTSLTFLAVRPGPRRLCLLARAGHDACLDSSRSLVDAHPSPSQAYPSPQSTPLTSPVAQSLLFTQLLC